MPETDYRMDRLQARWCFSCRLTTESAIHLGGGGDSSGIADLALLRDEVTGRPILTGTTLAGALRAHLTGQLAADGRRDIPEVADLFGQDRAGKAGGVEEAVDEGRPSPLLTFDAVAYDACSEIRDGVSLDPGRGTARDQAKYDMEVLPAGTQFALNFELEIRRSMDEQHLLHLFARAISGLEDGAIRLGARRTRGLGACSVSHWKLKRWDLTTREGWMRYLSHANGHPVEGDETFDDLRAAFQRYGMELSMPTPRRSTATLALNIGVTGGMLVRQPVIFQGGSDRNLDVDVIQFQSGGQAVIPGSSLAGALRNRALRIARLLREDQQDAEQRIAFLFGPAPDSRDRNKLTASRLRVSECVLKEGKGLRNARVKIDRFSGGAVDGALFDEAPSYGAHGRIILELLPRPGDSEEEVEAALGLLLLTVKDLLDGDLPLGGTSSVGRGFVRGIGDVHFRDQQIEVHPGKRPDPIVNQWIQRFIGTTATGLSNGGHA